MLTSVARRQQAYTRPLIESQLSAYNLLCVSDYETGQIVLDSIKNQLTSVGFCTPSLKRADGIYCLET